MEDQRKSKKKGESFQISKSNNTDFLLPTEELKNKATEEKSKQFRKSITNVHPQFDLVQKVVNNEEATPSKKTNFGFNSKKKPKEPKQAVDVFGEKALNEVFIKYKRIHNFHKSTYFQIFINFCTVYVLFADDARTLCCRKQSDQIFDGIMIFFIIIFCLDVLMSILAYKDYNFSFFFWLDILSTLSLISDLQWIQESYNVNELNFNQLEL